MLILYECLIWSFIRPTYCIYDKSNQIPKPPLAMFLYWFLNNMYLNPNLHTYSENSTHPNIYVIACILSQKFAKKMTQLGLPSDLLDCVQKPNIGWVG